MKNILQFNFKIRQAKLETALGDLPNMGSCSTCTPRRLCFRSTIKIRVKVGLKSCTFFDKSVMSQNILAHHGVSSNLGKTFVILLLRHLTIRSGKHAQFDTLLHCSISFFTVVPHFGVE